MLQRLYVHNYRCLENFEFKPGDISSALLIGNNGAGKSTVLRVLGVFQAIGRGTNRVAQLVEPADFTRGRAEVPMRLELEVVLNGHAFHYSLALELPRGFRELRVQEERLVHDGAEIFSRQQADVTVRRNLSDRPEARFGIDWHMVALPVIQDPASAVALRSLRDWMAAMVLLAPIPDPGVDRWRPRSMAVNKHKEHVWVVPEDAANQQIANGFNLDPALDATRFHVGRYPGGWLKVLASGLTNC